MPVTKVRPHERDTASGPQHVRGHMRKTSSSPSFQDELPPEGYDVEATVQGEADSKGNFTDAKVTEVKLRPKQEGEGK